MLYMAMLSSRNKWRTQAPSIPLSRVVIGTMILTLLVVAYLYANSFADFLSTKVVRSPTIRLDRPVTIVTAYYAIPSKFSDQQYFAWMANFLPVIPCHLYVYTDEKSANRLKMLRTPFMTRTKFVVKPFSELKAAKRMDMWKEQKKLDGERDRHSPELYIMWNEKVNFIMETIKDNAFDSDYFIWTDSGSFRSMDLAKKLVTYPDTNTTSLLLGTNKVWFLQMGHISDKERIIGANGLPVHNFQHGVRLGGGIFGGHANAMKEYERRFAYVMGLMLKNKMFIGKDQNVMASVAVLYPDLIKLVDPQGYLGGADPWFYGQYYFSKRELSQNELKSGK